MPGLLLRLALLLIVGLTAVRCCAAGTATEWVAVSRHALHEHAAASSFFADTVQPQHVVRHERIGRYHIYVLSDPQHGMDEGHAAHRYFAVHPATHMLVRNHPIEGTTLPRVHMAAQRPRARQSRYNPWQEAASERTWLVEGAACRSNTGAEGRRGYSAGGFAWGIDLLDWQQEGRLIYDGALCTAATGNTTHVYVIDTGIDPHVSFRHPVVQDYSWYAAAGISSSGNSGMRATAGTAAPAAAAAAADDGNTTGWPTPSGDCHGHGTHVAGLAASTIYGVAPDAQMHAIQALDCDGRGSFDALIAALLYVQEYGKRPAVVNLSLGVPRQYSTSVAMLIEELATVHGVPVVASAGNNGIDACDFFPANVPATISVAASNEQQQLAPFSNYGTCVDVVAPGNDIISCAPNNTAALLSGTSMATPMVSGLLALLQQRHPAHAGDAAWLRAKLVEEARPLLDAAALAAKETPNALAQVQPEQAGDDSEWHLPPPYRTPPYAHAAGTSEVQEPLSWTLVRSLLAVLCAPLFIHIFFSPF